MLTLTNIIFITISIIFLPKCIAVDYCGTNYCNSSKQHTLCKYKGLASHCTAYEKTIFTANDRQIILDKINSRRNKVAAGEIRSLPPAESMLKMEWNKELEISAQRWADQCVKHRVPDIQDTCRDLGKLTVGQNIATIHGESPGLVPFALVDVWYMELLNINSSIMLRYKPSETSNSHYDYFTQLVWEESNQVGCGGVKFKERLDDANKKYRTIYRLVCNFAPAGNIRNRSVYSSGVPCSRCPIDGSCDSVYEALCLQNSITINDAQEENSAISYRSDDVTENTTTNVFPAVSETITEDVISTSTESIQFISDVTLGREIFTPFDYFSHLFDYTKQLITSRTNTSSCKNIMAVDNFVELLKKKLINDPLIKDLLSTSKSHTISNSEASFDDVGVAAFIDGVYSKKELPTTSKPMTSEFVNSTFLVDLIEAVIFRSGDKMPISEKSSPNTPPLSSVQRVMVQAELAEVKQNNEFTGHYFFPEDEEQSNTESIESIETYYDDINLPVSDLVLEDLKISTVTNDFLDDILDSDTSIESTTAIAMLSPDSINLYKSGHGVMKKFLQNINQNTNSK
ncbi:hypothetical protein B5X24_HaOG206142 [Helicoverpa armigera]|nr:hypothetical protein B5X24_HaOG206142 [Helicoverpa armigera]